MVMVRELWLMVVVDGGRRWRVVGVECWLVNGSPTYSARLGGSSSLTDPSVLYVSIGLV